MDQPQPCIVFPLAIAQECDYAFGLVRNDTVRGHPVVDEWVAVDLANKCLADILPIPATAAGVHVAFEPEKKCLVVVDSKWEWIMLIDLATGEKVRAPADPKVE